MFYNNYLFTQIARGGYIKNKETVPDDVEMILGL